jgi:hypothetical protein
MTKNAQTSSNGAYWETNSSEAPQELNEPLVVRIGREVERHGRAAGVCPFAVGWYGVQFPGDFNNAERQPGQALSRSICRHRCLPASVEPHARRTSSIAARSPPTRTDPNRDLVEPVKPFFSNQIASKRFLSFRHSQASFQNKMGGRLIDRILPSQGHAGRPVVPQINVVLNWAEELKPSYLWISGFTATRRFLLPSVK